MDLSLKVDAAINMSRSEFNENYFKPQLPLVLKGLTVNKDAGKKWSINYFKETMGDVMVSVYDNANKKSSKSAFTKPDMEMKFAEYLDIMARNEHTDLRIFLFNLFKFNPQLRKEFPCPHLFKGLLDNIGLMFFGGKDTTVRIHYDIDISNVIHTHFQGRKRIVLISPQYTPYMYRLPLNTYSLINPLKPNYEKYPALKYVRGYDITLEPGDSLFMPSGYWHYMTYLEGGFSVSYRKMAPTLKTKLEGLMNIALLMPMDKLLNKVIGEKWFFMKEQIADSRIKKMNLDENITPIRNMNSTRSNEAFL